MAALLLLLAATTGAGAAEVAGTVVLHQQGRSKAPKASEDTPRQLGVELLNSSSFNTGAQPDILAHEKYSGRTAVELRKAAGSPAP